MGMYMPALRPPHTVPEGDDRLLQIRSRRKIDLERLRDELLPELGPTIRLPHTDYEYRAYCTHEQWARALAQAAFDIDYVKFKEQAEHKYGDVQLHNTYTSMWYTVFSTLSTKRHQNDYWSWQQPRTTRKKSRKAGTSRWDTDTTDVPRQPMLRDLIDSNLGITGDDISRWGGQHDLDDETMALVNEVSVDVPKIARKPNGHIDHTQCDHAPTRGARRRCRNRNRNN